MIGKSIPHSLPNFALLVPMSLSLSDWWPNLTSSTRVNLHHHEPDHSTLFPSSKTRAYSINRFEPDLASVHSSMEFFETTRVIRLDNSGEHQVG